MQQDNVDDWLESLSYDEPIGYHTSFETLAFTITTVNKIQNLEALQPKLAWKPLEVIKRTLEATIQWTVIKTYFHMRRHHISRFPWNNRTCLKETISMDTIFSPTKELNWSNCSQIFFGIMSRMLNIYHMPSKESVNIIKAYQDFMRYEGVPETLHRDLAPEQKTDDIVNINRNMIVKDTWSEAGYPTQNPVEQGGVRILKSTADTIITRMGAIPGVWQWVYNYIADINNHCANRILSWRTPIEKCHGYTPDISALLLYQFWEPIYYLMDEDTPKSKEKKGRCLSLSHNIVDKLTYFIYCEDSVRVVSWSVIQSVEPLKGSILNKSLEPTPFPSQESSVSQESAYSFNHTSDSEKIRRKSPRLNPTENYTEKEKGRSADISDTGEETSMVDENLGDTLKAINVSPHILCWTRTNPNAKVFYTTKKGGPNWQDV